MFILNQCTAEHVTDPESVKSLSLRHHAFRFGLFKSLCSGLYQSTRKQCYIYCCSEFARSVSLLHGFSEGFFFCLFLRNLVETKLDTHKQN